MAEKPTWTFWLPDADRSTGWTNHGYVWQRVCDGVGDTVKEAWRNALEEDCVPPEFELPESLIATKVQDERELFAEDHRPKEPKMLILEATVRYEIEVEEDRETAEQVMNDMVSELEGTTAEIKHEHEAAGALSWEFDWKEKEL